MKRIVLAVLCSIGCDPKPNNMMMMEGEEDLAEVVSDMAMSEPADLATNDDLAQAMTGCTDDTQCDINMKCDTGKCVTPVQSGLCMDTTQCPNGNQCVSGKCEVAALNGTCMDPTDCTTGQTCNSGTMKCYESVPSAPCVKDYNCPSGYVCDANKTCSQKTGMCPTDFQCRADQECKSGSCVKKTCNSSADCTVEGDYCDGTAQECKPAPAEGGNSCGSDANCAAGNVCNTGTHLCGAAPIGGGNDCDPDADHCANGFYCAKDTKKCESTTCTMKSDCHSPRPVCVTLNGSGDKACGPCIVNQDCIDNSLGTVCDELNGIPYCR